MKEQTTLYGVFNLQGEIQYKGICRDVAEKCGIEEHSLYAYITTDKKLNKSYFIRKLKDDGITPTRKIWTAPKKPKKEDENLEYLKYHLMVYGQTICSSFDPVPYLPKLLDMGMNCRVREMITPMENGIKSRRGRKKKPDVDYIIEVVK